MHMYIASLWVLLLLPSGQRSPGVIVNVQNNCENTSEKFLGKNHTVLPDGVQKTHRQHLLAISGNSAYSLVVCSDTFCQNYGNMTFLSGREYNVEISECNLPGIVIKSHEAAPAFPTLLDPPRIRFRSRKVAPTEFRHDALRYRRLSVGMTSYSSVGWPAVSPGTRIQFRHSFTSKGPVIYSSRHIVSLKPGHRYFAEVQYFGAHKEMFKLQDEGVIPRLKR
jgi:hypothetical protein